MLPDATAAGGYSPRLCVNRVCPGLVLPFYWWLLYWNTYSVCGLFFGKWHAQLEVRRVVRVLLEVGSMMARQV